MQYSRDCITITSNNLFFHFQKHPHLRGENQVSSWIGLYFGETSPPAWGKLRERVLDSITAGNIPTCVGKTLMHGIKRIEAGKHPHLRGENKCARCRLEMPLETSPPAWGKPALSKLTALRTKKHPHLRGENLFANDRTAMRLETSPPAWGKLQASSPVEDSVETSPPAWGKLGSSARPTKATRNIPTCVGKTLCLLPVGLVL